MTDYPVTAESVAAAKAAQRAERARVTALTGVVINDDGTVQHRDDVRLGMRLGNAVWAAVFGIVRGGKI